MTKIASQRGFDGRTPTARPTRIEGLVEGLSGLVTISALIGTLLWAAGLLAVQQDLVNAVPSWWAIAVWSLIALLVRAAWQATALSERRK